MRSLQTRLFLAITLVAATALIAVGAFSTRTIALQLQWLQRSSPLVLRAGLSQRVQTWYRTHHSWHGVSAILRTSGTDAVLFASDGRFIAASFGGVEDATLTRGRDATIRLVLSGPGAGDGVRELLVRSAPSLPIVDAGRTVAEIVPVRIPPATPPNRVVVLGRELWLAILCALVAALAAAVILARNMLAPVRSLSEATKAMHAGDLTRRVSTRGPAEIAELAERFNELAAHLERSEALRQRMIADIAHELRTPLTNIRGMIEAIEDGHMRPNETTLTSLAEEALLLERIVNDLQDLSLADAGQLRFELHDVSAGASARAVIAAVEPAAREKEISIELAVKTESDIVRADESRLRQILTNLLSNAIRLAPQRSAIRVVVEALPGSVQVSVCDEGPGLSNEALEAVFERFYRADQSRSRRSGGAGLGLAIAKQLVEAHGGRIGVTSNEGHGATFAFALPNARRV